MNMKTISGQSVASSIEPSHVDPWVTKAQLSAHFQMSPRTIERNVAAGMPVHRCGNRARFSVIEVQHWLDSNQRDRFAAQGRAATRQQLKRIVAIPILNGLQILQHPPKP